MRVEEFGLLSGRRAGQSQGTVVATGGASAMPEENCQIFVWYGERFAQIRKANGYAQRYVEENSKGKIGIVDCSNCYEHPVCEVL